MQNPHKLNIDLKRNTENIKIIKIAVENATIYAEKSMRYAHFAEICGKNATTRKVCGKKSKSKSKVNGV